MTISFDLHFSSLKMKAFALFISHLYIVLSIFFIITENVVLSPEMDRSYPIVSNINLLGMDPNKVEMGFVELIPQQTQMLFQNALNGVQDPELQPFPSSFNFQGGQPQNFQGFQGPNFQDFQQPQDFQQGLQGQPISQGFGISTKRAIRKLFILAIKGIALGGIALVAIPTFLIALPLLAIPFLIYVSITMLPMLIGPFVLLAIVLRLRPLNVNVIPAPTTAATTSASGRIFLNDNRGYITNLHPELAIEILSPVVDGKASYCTERIFCEISKSPKTSNLKRVVNWIYQAFDTSALRDSLHARIEAAGKKGGNCEQFQCDEKINAVRKFFDWNE